MNIHYIEENQMFKTTKESQNT